MRPHPDAPDPIHRSTAYLRGVVRTHVVVLVLLALWLLVMLSFLRNNTGWEFNLFLFQIAVPSEASFAVKAAWFALTAVLMVGFVVGMIAWSAWLHGRICRDGLECWPSFRTFALFLAGVGGLSFFGGLLMGPHLSIDGLILLVFGVLLLSQLPGWRAERQRASALASSRSTGRSAEE